MLEDIGDGILKDPEYGKHILEPLEILGVDKFGDSAAIVEATITTKSTRQWAVGWEINPRVKRTSTGLRSYLRVEGFIWVSRKSEREGS